MRIQVANSQSLHPIEKIIMQCCENSIKSLGSHCSESSSYQRRLTRIGLSLTKVLKMHISVNTNESLNLRPIEIKSFNPEFLPLVQTHNSIGNQSEDHYDELILALRQCIVRIKNYDIRNYAIQTELADIEESETELELHKLASTLKNTQDSIERINAYKVKVKETKVSEYAEKEIIILDDVLTII